MRVLISIMLFVIVGASNAEPVYLKCSKNEQDSKPYHVTVDESLQSVTYLYMAGVNGDEEKGFNLPGFFKADTVSFVKNDDIGGLSTSTTIVINRNNLKYTMTLNSTRGKENKMIIEGQCKIITVAGRKF